MSDDFYVPSREYLRKQSQTNNQGRSDEEVENVGLLQYEYNRAHDSSHIAYQNLLREDVSREIARAVLPVSNYTEVVWKSDLHNFFHMVGLRSDKHAQQEIRDYSDAMYEMVKPLYPISCKAFEDYVLNSISFSQEELRIIKTQIDGSWTMSDYDLTAREQTEFLEKLS